MTNERRDNLESKMATEFPGMTASQVLLYVLDQAQESVDEQLYALAASYMQDADTVKNELDHIAIFGTEEETDK